MSTYAISDLHLSFGVNKPMNIFGKVWKDYEIKIADNWENTVSEDDIVLIPGDISWGITLKETLKDFKYINEMPGRKIILKGNHDYYFTTKTKVEQFFKENSFNTIEILHNNAIDTEEYIIAGTRGWGKTEGSDKVKDEKIFKREELRLRLSLNEAAKINKEKYENTKPIIVAMHFPPFVGNYQNIIEEYNVKTCIYGHLHGFGHHFVKEGMINGVEYKMVGCDYTGFELVKL